MSQPPPPGAAGPPAAAEPPATYHCRHCSNQVSRQAVVCVTCGCQPWTGTAFCWYCRTPTHPQAQVCVSCGVSLVQPQPTSTVGVATGSYTFMTTPAIDRMSHRSAVTAGVLGILLGGFGVHRFYLGYTGAGFAILGSVVLGFLLSILILPFFLAVAASILALVEGILLLTGAFDTDADGARLQR